MRWVIEELLQRGQCGMPLFGVCLVPGFRRGETDQAQAGDIGERVEIKDLFVGSGSLV